MNIKLSVVMNILTFYKALKTIHKE